MRRRCQPWVGQLLFLSVALAGTPSVVSADPVSLSSGIVNWDGNCAGVAIKDGGFRLCLADLAPAGGGMQTTGPGGTGDALSGASTMHPAELSGGTLFVSGGSFGMPNAGSFGGDFEMILRISGTFAGTPAGPPFLSINFGGLGVPTFVIERFATGGIPNGFGSDSAPSPSPEPATLLLLGTGLAGLALRARSRRRT